MKVTFRIDLEGGIKLPVVVEMETFGDIKKLGTKLVQLQAGFNKMMPGSAALKLVAIGAIKDKADGA